MEHYYLYLNKDVFLWFNKKKMCIYNSSNQKNFVFQNNEVLNNIIEELNEIENLYQIRLSKELLSNEIIDEWINKIIQIEAGGIYEGSPEEIVSFKPMLRIQQKKEFYVWQYNEKGDSGKIMNNLNKLIIHLNGSKHGNIFFFKQISYPKESVPILNKDLLLKFIANSSKAVLLSKIYLLGTLYEYPQYHQLIKELNTLHYSIVYSCIDKDFIENRTVIYDLLNENFNLNIIVTDYDNKNHFLTNPNISYTFIVQSENEIDKAEEIITNHQLNNYKIIPVYTGNNLSFLEDNIYMVEEDFQDIKLSKREIFAHQALNTNDFGTLTITSDGSIYTNTSQKPVGTIEESPHNIIFREITEGNSWLKIREQEPCCNCIYQWLCPSPSNYESVIGRNNLCHIEL